MPGFDKTGPEGKGSRTGRGFGKCNPSNKESDKQIEAEEHPRGRGLGQGRRKGRGFGRSNS